jgi:hypothetical protein
MPKSGGTTLKSIIKANTKPKWNYDVYYEKKIREKKLRELSKKRVSCIQGHFPFGVHRHFRKSCTYITMLREPIDRLISEYYFIRNSPKHKQYFKIKKMSLDEYLSLPSNKNKQTRLISGSNENQLTRSHLEKAKENIKKHFSVAGITEMFNESLFLMQKEFGWKYTFLKKTNVNKKRPPVGKVPKKTIRLAINNNQLDIELYAFVKKLLEQKITRLKRILPQK